MSTKNVMIQYRQLKTEGLKEGFELKSMLIKVLRQHQWHTKAKHRIIDLDQDQSFVILNKLTEQDTWNGPVFAGQLIQLQKGSDIHAITQSLEDETPEYLLQRINIGEKNQVIKGVLYFAIVKNHVGIIESSQLKGRTFERYLTALFQKAEEIDLGQAIILNSKFIAENGKGLDSSSEITIAAKRSSGTIQNDDLKDTTREMAHAHEQGATVYDVLTLLGWAPEAINSLRSEVPADGWVEGLFSIFIKEKRKRKSISRATIDEALRNIDAADLGLRGDGSEKNGIVKLSVKRPVQIQGSLLDPTNAIEQIVNALRDWADAGKIDCTFEG